MNNNTIKISTEDRERLLQAVASLIKLSTDASLAALKTLDTVCEAAGMNDGERERHIYDILRDIRESTRPKRRKTSGKPFRKGKRTVSIVWQHLITMIHKPRPRTAMSKQDGRPR